MRPDEARPRLAALGFCTDDVETLAAHFLDAESRGQLGHGLSRIEWLETWDELDAEARPRRVESTPGYERWDGAGALGYLTLEAVIRAQLAEPPERSRLVVCSRTFPTGALGYWVRRLAEGGLVGVLTATSPRRLSHPEGGEAIVPNLEAITDWARPSTAWFALQPEEAFSMRRHTDPRSVNLSAFESRFLSTCCRRLASVTIVSVGRSSSSSTKERDRL